MNKQQLASRIWESANRLRSKIEANEYKDYILGFIFYKFLSDREVHFLKAQDWSEEALNKLSEDDQEAVSYCQRNLGYFISYENLFSSWLSKGRAFDVANVRDALSAFSRLINDSYKKVFYRIFETLQTGLSKLGDTAGSQTRAINDLLQLIRDIPMDGTQDYDVLGFIYEYLLSNFAANAGKKAGEFYTPHEVSLLMSELIAHHLKDRKEIEIYDSTSGSGSLLITIGKSVARYINNKNNIKYYAQEWKENTYNLTRMNLIMRGILPDNIITRNGDTLEDDWPYFEEDDPNRTYRPLYVDAVVSNPPYSQHWESDNKESDPRFNGFGLAPKSKADYAFLLHDLYHLKPNGMMAIVLPHGVLFRGGEEENIRRSLIERNHIDVVIGLPANIFFGTGIPTIIMVLRKNRPHTDVLFVDASKGFIKAGKNNKLQASNIRKIVDAVIDRADIAKFSRSVAKDEIVQNDYNLNIPRYVDSSNDAETWDIYATMKGGIPNAEIDLLKEYWRAFPRLKKSLFKCDGTPYSTLAVEDIKETIVNNSGVKSFIESFNTAFESFGPFLESEFITKMFKLTLPKEEAKLCDDIFTRLESIPFVDKYQAYQILDDNWVNILNDLEMIQTEGFDAVKKVDPRMVIKKVNGRDEEVQDGWIGHIIPFELAQSTFLHEQYGVVKQKEQRLEEISAEYTDMIDTFSEEEKDGNFLNEDNNAFVPAGVTVKIKEFYADIDSEEISGLNGYLKLIEKKENKATKGAKLKYIAEHQEVDWSAIEGKGVYGKGPVNTRIKQLRQTIAFPEDTFESKIIHAAALMDEEKKINKDLKILAGELHQLTKETIEGLSDHEAKTLLNLKWIKPLVSSLHELPNAVIDHLVSAVRHLSEKYALTFLEIESQIDETEKALSAMIDKLEGDAFDMEGLRELKNLLGGE